MSGGLKKSDDTMIVRLRLLVLAGICCVALLATTFTTAQAGTSSIAQVRGAVAPNRADGLPSKPTIKRVAVGGPEVVVTCGVEAQDPVVSSSAGTVSGVALITGCSPEPPDLCSIQADVQVFDMQTQTWVVIAPSDPQYGPPCADLKSTARGTCEYRSVIHYFRTRAIGVVVEGGDTGNAGGYSSEVGYHCY